MVKLIGKNNRVNYGCIDEPIEWNYEDFKLLDFFNKEIKGFKKKWAYHQFNYVGITAGDYIVGFATVDLGYLCNVFAFIYSKEKGIILESDDKCLGFSKKMNFPRNPDNYLTSFKSGKTSVSVEKSHEKGMLSIDCNFKDRLKFKGTFPFSIDSHQPLRVLNPSVPTRFTYTEKCSPLRPTHFELSLDGNPLKFETDKVVAIYDWSGGYLRRETNWYWTAFGAVLPDKTSIGANLAALTNETYFSENAFWIDHKRTRVSRVLYDFNQLEPYETWRIYDEAGSVNLIFTPEGERNDKINGGPFVKTVFRQFVGAFDGFFKPENGEKIEFKEVKGFCEIHRAIW
ncbi:DUF2804 domain-containing protein [bacterium]|nr:DUF2804 domain-containing protein [bacterium]